MTPSMNIRSAAQALMVLTLTCPGFGQQINLEQLSRVLNGETIQEQRSQATEFSSSFQIADCVMASDGANQYMSLEPGHHLYLAGESEEGFVEKHIVVLPEEFDIMMDLDGHRMQARSRVIEERSIVDGVLEELSLLLYARCLTTNDIYLLGDVGGSFDNGTFVPNDDNWLAGTDDIRPGLMMPGTALIGSRYYHEFAPGIAMDRAEHLSVGTSRDVPAGTFDRCLVVQETSGLDDEGNRDERSIKIYSEGVGLIQDEALQLVTYRVGSARRAGGDGIHLRSGSVRDLQALIEARAAVDLTIPSMAP